MVIQDNLGGDPACHAGLGADPSRQWSQASAITGVLSEESLNRFPLIPNPRGMTLPDLHGDESVDTLRSMALARPRAHRGQELAAVSRHAVL